MYSFKKQVLLLTLLFVLKGCGIFSSSPPTVPLEKRSLNSVMQEGIETFKNGNFDKAIKIFGYIKDTYPFTPEALIAQLRLADVYYYKHDYQNALLSYQQFIKLHPKHKQAPYALYQAGMCYFHQIPSIDRDQTPTKNALEIFKRLIKEHPTSRYTKRALIKIKICREKLAAHEFYVGRFYYRTGRYKSALLRFRNLIENYYELPISRKAQVYLDRCKSKLKKKQYNPLLSNE